MNFYNNLLKQYFKIYPYIENFRGSYRIRYIIKEKVKQSMGKIVEFEIYDTKISAPTNTSQAVELAAGRRGLDELDQLEYILENIGDEDVFVDVGASFGLFSSVIANNTAAEVHSFEPLSLNTSFQQLNQELFGYGFSINRKAVSDSKGKTELVLSVNSHGQNFISDSADSDQEKIQTVEKTLLDEELEQIDYIKIDVEGAELRVLQGAENLIERCKPIILLELHRPDMLDRFNSSGTEVKEFLESKGYEMPHKLSHHDGKINLIVKPK